MVRLALGALLTLALVSGCGGETSEGSPSSGSSPRASASPSASTTATYFAPTDSAAINDVSAKAYNAGAKAAKLSSRKRCNRAGSRGYAAWRRCWHGLLDPFQGGLTSMSTELTTLSSRDFPEKCQGELKTAAGTFTGFAARVGTLAAGIDSNKRPAQVKAMRTYLDVIDQIFKAYYKPFPPLTQACYSPKDLASINASPSASPTGSPTGSPSASPSG